MIENEHNHQKKTDDLIVFFEDAIIDITRAYHDFNLVRPDMDSKSFGAHHSACRAALSHLDLVFKLKQKMQEAQPDAGGDIGDNVSQNLERLIMDARAELNFSGD